MTPCYDDVDVDPAHLPPLGTNPKSLAPDNPGTGGATNISKHRRRARTRSNPVPIANTHDLWITMYTTTKPMRRAAMARLIDSAIDTVISDTGNPNRQYSQLTVGM